MNTKTVTQVKQELNATGKPVSTWAKERGFTPQEVYKVLNGQVKGNFGRAHQIAVALGLKQGQEVTV
ncbi:DNA-binding protein [Acinetobacter bereziniae]|uniref:DNA-binding protein n=1 Tax=Acinetobacter bereziniae TaxID=106648 RepID=UPI000EF70BDA|nr:DNA-binding protein [Acinetobacter bereziniae]MBJ8477193.1 DNA-binding protein [Acinetobacter bereziniae]